jgi:hypothetical protein
MNGTRCLATFPKRAAPHTYRRHAETRMVRALALIKDRTPGRCAVRGRSLGKSLRNLLVLSSNVHDLWCADRFGQGGQHGERSDRTATVSRFLKPLSDFSPAELAFELRLVSLDLQTIVRIRREIPQGESFAGLIESDQFVRRLAPRIHWNWCRATIEAGFHTTITEWVDLSPDRQEAALANARVDLLALLLSFHEAEPGRHDQPAGSSQALLERESV